MSTDSLEHTQFIFYMFIVTLFYVVYYLPCVLKIYIVYWLLKQIEKKQQKLVSLVENIIGGKLEGLTNGRVNYICLLFI